VLTEAMAQCVDGGVAGTFLLFATPGGSVRQGICPYNMLRAYPFKLVV
jgi:hypothetical protein